MCIEKKIQELKNSELSVQLYIFIDLIKNLQDFYKKNKGKYFGASELSKVKSLDEILEQFHGLYDTNSYVLNNLYFEDKKLRIKSEATGNVLTNIYFEFHEHKGTKEDETGFTIYLYFTFEEMNFFMSKGFGFGSQTNELTIITENEI